MLSQSGQASQVLGSRDCMLEGFVGPACAGMVQGINSLSCSYKQDVKPRATPKCELEAITVAARQVESKSPSALSVFPEVTAHLSTLGLGCKPPQDPRLRR